MPPWFVLLLLAAACAAPAGRDVRPLEAAGPRLGPARPLTASGKNGEGYFSPDGRRIAFQGVPDGSHYYRIFVMDADDGNFRAVSPLPAKTTCAFFAPDGQSLIFASTHHTPQSALEPPKPGRRYQWDFDPCFDIFRCNPDGSGLEPLTFAPGYDAEGSYAPDGRRIVFTSMRDGDPEIYVMNADGTDPRRITNAPGYDGGPFFAPDGRRIVWRRFAPDGDTSRLMIANDDGSAERPLTRFSAMPWAPFFHPDGRRIVFACNTDTGPHGEPRNFELFLIGDDGTGLVRLTHDAAVDILPVFSPDGRRLLWTSTRWDASPDPRARKSQLTIADFRDATPAAGRPEITAEDARRHVTFLAGADAEGRRPGTLGGEMGSSYIAGEFRRFGLTPAGDDGTFFQWFTFVYSVHPGPGNALEVRREGTDPAIAERDKDFFPLRMSKSGAVEADAVHAGYGIVLPDGGQDDYAGRDVKGRAAVVFDGAPEGWTGKHHEHADRISVRRKAAAAAEKGALALVVVGDAPHAAAADPHALGDVPEAPLPVVRVTKAFWTRALEKAAAGGKGPLRLSLRAEMIRERRETCNVVGVWPASPDTAPSASPGTGRDEAVVLGAHHDHLGRGLSDKSLAETPEGVHHGADDNASGVAGLLEAAQAIAAAGRRFPRAIVFIAFGAEELGLLGAAHYLEHPAVPLDRTVAMVNMDMIGRLASNTPKGTRAHTQKPAGGFGGFGGEFSRRSAGVPTEEGAPPPGAVSIQGVGTSPLWASFVRALEGRAAVPFTLRQDGFGPSDHNLFCVNKIPVLYFFTGLHDDYHKPSDTVEKLNYEGLAEVARWAREAAEAAASAPERPVFVEVQPPPLPARGGFRVYLGTIPDYTADVDGVRLAGVRPGSPADKAGLRAGDVIVRFGKTAVGNIHDYTFALQDCAPGREVEVTVRRDGKDTALRVTPAGRGER